MVDLRVHQTDVRHVGLETRLAHVAVQRSEQFLLVPRLSDQISISAGMLGDLFDSLLDISRLDVAGIAQRSA